MTKHDNWEPIDLDAAVVRSLAKLAGERMPSFSDQEQPPDEIASWIEQASLPQTHAVLCLSLRRWHELVGRQR